MEYLKLTQIVINNFKTQYMKIYIYIVTFMFTSVASCQMTVNIIPETEYYNVSINGKTLSQIIATQGNATNVQNLFSNSILETRINSDPFHPSYGYKYDGLDLGFSGSGIGNPQEIELVSFEITNNDWSFSIQDITFKVGNDISLLGNVNFNDDADNTKSIVYQFCDGCNNYIGINFNQVTKKITKIYFLEIP